MTDFGEPFVKAAYNLVGDETTGSESALKLLMLYLLVFKLVMLLMSTLGAVMT